MAKKSRYEEYVKAIQSLQEIKQETKTTEHQTNNETTHQGECSTKKSVLAKLKELKGKPGIVRVPVGEGENNA